MNIIPLKQQPDKCPACGNVKAAARACDDNCLRISMADFIRGTTMNQESEPHVHVTCIECGFTFLLECAEPDEVRRVW